MKAAFIVFITLLSGLISVAQTNIFPSSGNVGVGTTTPSRKVDVIGVTKSDGFIVNIDGSASSAAIRLVDDGNGIFRPAANVFAIATSETERFRITSSGYLGIGESSPNVLQHLSTNASGVIDLIRLQNKHSVAGDGVGIAFNSSANGTADLTRIWADRDNVGFNMYFSAGGVEKIKLSSDGNTLFSNGNIGIGTAVPTEKLSVNGNISAKKLIVTQSGWSDYVFDKDYQLRSLQSLEAFINKNKHLPEIPTAKEVEVNGISIGDTQALLLKKIEELTLYIIIQQKQIDRLIMDVRKIKK